MDEKEVLAKYSTPGLKKNLLTRASKREAMEFDENYRHLTLQEREEFLDRMFPTEPASPLPDQLASRPENTDPNS